MSARRLQRDWMLGLALVGLWSCRSHETDPELLAGGYAPPPPVTTDVERGSYLAGYPGLEGAALEIESASEGAPSPLSQDELTMVLQYHCGECHFAHEELQQAASGLFYMDDMDELIATGKVIPGDGEGSRLVLRMRLGEMPPVSSNTPPVPVATVDRIVQYINVLRVPPPVPPAPARPLPWQEEARNRPNVPPIDAACFRYLGDWIRCEEAGTGLSNLVEVPGADLQRCLQECRERADCVAVTDWTWLNLPALGCVLYTGSCDAPSTGVWHEEDAGRDYLKLCAED